MSKRKLTHVQYSIIDRLFFTEPFARLVEELTEPRTVIAAELKELIVKGLVQPMEYDQGRDAWKATFYYDSDNMHVFRYRATGKGIEAYEQHKA